MFTKILKFGGSSLASSLAIANVLEIIATARESGENNAIVVSAIGKTTNRLVEAAELAQRDNRSFVSCIGDIEEEHLKLAQAFFGKKSSVVEQATFAPLFEDLRNILDGISLVKEVTLRMLDFVMSFGERLSALLISSLLQEKLAASEFIDARILVKTDNHFGNAKVLFAQTMENVTSYFAHPRPLPVITGFIGSTLSGETTTLGRGGSDYTAALFGQMLGVREIEIWTDVNGVMTADPRKVSKAFSLAALTYEEAMELSHFGAKVIYPPSLQPALLARIPLLVKNTFQPSFPGTRVFSSKPPSEQAITGISSMKEIALLRVCGSGMIGIAGISMRLFGALARQNISVIFISQASSEHTICFAVPLQCAELAKNTVEEEFRLEIQSHQIDGVIVEPHCSILAVIGENMRNTPGISGKVFQALGKNGINVIAIAQGSSELNISFVVAKTDESKALNALHDAFFLSGIKSVHLFLVGTGRVGSALLEQISRHALFLEQEQHVNLKIVGIANRHKMFFEPQGVALSQWRTVLESTTQLSSIENFVRTMKDLNLPNSVFLDCTASSSVADAYENILDASISVVTPNKRANSGSFATYQKLKQSAQKRNVKYFYETNVGAGLPVISTLNDLLVSGDEVLKIEAVLSGTLSYVFHCFNGNDRFSEIIRRAKEKGLTEPHPREDLSGKDVARKLLVLAREMGIALEEADIMVESLVPESCQNIEAVDEFFHCLSRYDDEFEARRAAACKGNQVLRYIATLYQMPSVDKPLPVLPKKDLPVHAGVSLQAVSQDHPFYSLSGTDNIISFTTKRYFERPLVIKGPGAGTDVTAAGVFADILRVASYLT